MSSDIDYRGITLIKFLAVFFMIINHSFVWFLSAGGLKIIHPELLFGDQNQYFYIICNFSMIIPIIAGYNFGKGIHIYCEGDRILNFPFRRVISIFIFLFFIEFLINWLAYGWLTLYHWNALTLIGSGFVFCILLGNISLNLIPLGGIFVLVIYALLDPSRTNYLLKVFFADNGQEYFWPIFPWISLVLFGFWYSFLSKKSSYKLILEIGSFAFLLFLLISGLKYDLQMEVGYVWGDALFQPPIIYIFELFAFFIFLLKICQLIEDKCTFKKYGMIRCYSQGILYIYLLHTIIGYKFSSWLYPYFLKYPGLIFYSFLLFICLFSWLIGFYALRLLVDKKIVLSRSSISGVSTT